MRKFALLLILLVAGDVIGQARFRRWRRNDGSTPIVDSYFSMLTSGLASSDSNLCSTYSSEMTGTSFCYDADGSGSTGTAVVGTVTSASSFRMCPNGDDCDAISTTKLEDGDGYLTAGTTSPAGDFSACWFGNTFNETPFLIAKDDGGGTRGWYIAIATTGLTFAVNKSNASGTAVTAGTADSIIPGAFHLVCMTYDFVTDGTSVIRGYLDGAAIGTPSTTAVGPVQSSALNVYVGRRNSSVAPNFLQGHVRYVFFTEKVLSAATITNIDASLRPRVKGDLNEAITFSQALNVRYGLFETPGETFLGLLTTGMPIVTGLGVLLEGARTNLVIRANEFDTGWSTAGGLGLTVSANAGESPTGVFDAEFIQSNVGGGDGNEYLQSTALVPGQTTGTASVWIKNSNSGELAQVVVRDTTAGIDRATCTGFALSSNWTRFSCNATGLTSGNNHVLRIFPGSVSGPISVDGVYMWGAQFEAPLANFMTSNTTTTTASVARPNAAMTWSNATDISTAGCATVTATFGQSAQFGGSLISNGTEMIIGTTNSTTIRINDGTNSVTATVPDMTGRTVKLKASWSGSTMKIMSITDGVSSTGTFDGSFSSTATMHAGRTSAASGYGNAWLRYIKLGTKTAGCVR